MWILGKRKKAFSILGASISTLEGYNPRGYRVFYTGEVCERSGVYTMDDTWWGIVIKHFGGYLLQNNSWSGSRVTKFPESTTMFPAGCCDERTASLHTKKKSPDIIIVDLGGNDWAYGVPLEKPTNSDRYELEFFKEAYSVMLQKLRWNYPSAEIWCRGLGTTMMSAEPEWVFPETFGGIHQAEFNAVIAEQAQQYSCLPLDIGQWGIPVDTIDGTHPNKTGMSTLAELVIRSVELLK